MGFVAHIGTTHFEELLQAHFGEKGREVILPILYGRLFAGKLRQAAIEKVAETFSGDVDVFLVADDEIHRHVERVVSILLEAETGFEHEGQHAGTIVVGIAPDLAAIAQIAGVAAVGEG